jgi:hypothetical protein
MVAENFHIFNFMWKFLFLRHITSKWHKKISLLKEITVVLAISLLRKE